MAPNTVPITEISRPEFCLVASPATVRHQVPLISNDCSRLSSPHHLAPTMFSKKLTVPVGKAAEGESAPRRNVNAKAHPDETPKAAPEVTTVYELFKHGTAKFKQHPAMGQRKFIKIHHEEKEIERKVDGELVKQKKKWQYYELGDYEWISFSELKDTVEQVAVGLRDHVQPGERLSIYCRTSMEWMQTFLACASQSICVVTAYDTLGVEGLRSSINEAETVAILTDKENFGTLSKTLEHTPTIKTVFYRETDGELTDAERKAMEQIKEKVKVVPFSQLQTAKGTFESVPPKPEDCACIMYTSGSTGKPKGVILNHSTVIGGVAGATGNITCNIVTPGDVFLSLLPLAHIFELTVELSCFLWGAALGYGNPKTASDASMRNCAGDIRTLKPTILAAVPAIWESVKKGIMAKVEKESGLKQALFWKALGFKHRCRSWGLPTPLVDTIVFKKIKEGTGGRLRFLFNGGAALSRDTRVFLDTVVAPCLMGYGLTETNAMAAIMTPANLDFSSTGEIVTSITMKLRDCEELGYKGSNNQGEVLIKGPCVTPGYFKNEEETKKVFTEDGWFCTGDIGQFASNGALEIIDRVKNLVKTQNGEYVAVERLEALYRSNKYVSNLCVFADSDHPKPVAIVVLAEPAVKAFAEHKGIDAPEHDLPQFAYDNKEVYKEILSSIQQTGRDCELKPVEILPAVGFSQEEWTPQNGFVTSAQKVQRRKIAEANEKELKEAFAKTK